MNNVIKSKKLRPVILLLIIIISCTASVIYLGSLYDKQEAVKQQEMNKIINSGNSTFDSIAIIKDSKKNIGK